MRSIVAVAAFGLAVAVSATVSQAAILNFTGQMVTGTNSPPFLTNGTFTIIVDYPESTSSVSTIGGASPGTTFSAQKDGGGTIDYTKSVLSSFTLTFSKNGTADQLTLSGLFSTSAAGQPLFGTLDLTFERAGTGTVPLLVSAANVATMLSAGTVYEGTFRQTNDLTTVLATAQLSGTIPVPEPGSISLLAGLGLVCGRRVWRRRQQKQAAAV